MEYVKVKAKEQDKEEAIMIIDHWNMESLQDNDPGFFFGNLKYVSKNKGDILFAEMKNGKIFIGSYEHSDQLNNLYLTHVTAFSKRNEKLLLLRRCCIKFQALCSVFTIKSNEDGTKDKCCGYEEIRYNLEHQKLYNRLCTADAVFYNMNPSQHEITKLPKNNSITASNEKIKMDEQARKEIIDMLKKKNLKISSAFYTGTYMWNHIARTGKNWQENEEKEIKDEGMRKAAMSLNWRGGTFNNTNSTTYPSSSSSPKWSNNA